MVKIRILILAEYYDPYFKGGAEYSLKSLIDKLKPNLDIQLYVLTPNMVNNTSEIDGDHKTYIRRYKSKKYGMMKQKELNVDNFKSNFLKRFNKPFIDYYKYVSKKEMVKETEEFIKDVKVNLIISNNNESMDALDLVKTNIPKIAFFRDIHNFNIPKTINNFICVSEFLKNQLINKNTCIIHNIIESEVTNKPHILENYPRILYIGDKNPDKCADVFSHIATMCLNMDNHDFQFYTVGLTENDVSVYKPSNITYLNKISQDEIFNLYYNCNMLIIPYAKPMGVGRIMVEAMQNRIPIITSDCGGSEELIENEVTCLTANTNNPYDFKCKIQKLYNEPELRNKIINNAYEKVNQVYNTNINLNKFNIFCNKVYYGELNQNSDS